MTRYNPADAAVGDTLYLAEPYGWSSYNITEWTVTRKTPGGQVVCRRGGVERRLTKTGTLIGGDRWSRARFVSEEEAAELRQEKAERDRWQAIADAALELRTAARGQDADAARAAFAKIAQGMSAGTAETAQQAQGEARQPGPQDAPTGSSLQAVSPAPPLPSTIAGER